MRRMDAIHPWAAAKVTDTMARALLTVAAELTLLAGTIKSPAGVAPPAGQKPVLHRPEESV
jgi:hypothetical protein